MRSVLYPVFLIKQVITAANKSFAALGKNGLLLFFLILSENNPHAISATLASISSLDMPSPSISEKAFQTAFDSCSTAESM